MRASGQEIEKFVSLQARQVDFDGKRFDILPNLKRLRWKTIMGVFGTWVVCYHLVWYSRYPEDPDVYNLPVESPEVRHNMNQEEKYRAYHKSEASRNVNVKSRGGFMQYLPYIIIAVVLIGIIYVIYTQGKDMTVVKTTLQSILDNMANR